MAATQVIREKFFSGYRETEFIVVCDVCRENSQVVKELSDAQVNLSSTFLKNSNIFVTLLSF